MREIFIANVVVMAELACSRLGPRTAGDKSGVVTTLAAAEGSEMAVEGDWKIGVA